MAGPGGEGAGVGRWARGRGGRRGERGGLAAIAGRGEEEESGDSEGFFAGGVCGRGGVWRQQGNFWGWSATSRQTAMTAALDLIRRHGSAPADLRGCWTAYIPPSCGASCECRLAPPASSIVDPSGMEGSKWRKTKAAQHRDDDV
ncbi:hypothetical protein ACQJBY_023069 [Aegilops geniculata]